MFPTQRVLGARALVCDSFEKDRTANDTTGVAAARASAGMQMHREGYNVLYGDGHASWYGDPQQRVIWWPMGDWGPHMYSGATRAIFATEESVHSRKNTLCQSDLVWHLLDNANGVDVGVAYEELDF